jgi:hypothetical protein
MAGRVMLAVVPVAAVLAAAAPAVRATSGGPPAPDPKPPQAIVDIPAMADRIEIDGRKNPEMIPQWDVWHAAFELMAKRSDLPTELYKAFSKEEVALVLEAGRENARNFLACQERILELVPTLQTEEARRITEKTQAINLEFRWQVLRLRDRVLADLSVTARTAMSRYVESLKEGMRVLVPKKELAFYRQPQ